METLMRYHTNSSGRETNNVINNFLVQRVDLRVIVHFCCGCEYLDIK